MRRLVKRLAEGVLVGSGVAALARSRLRGRSLVLSYHNVVPDHHEPQGDRSLHLPRRSFLAQLDAIQRHMDVVSLPDAVRGGGARGRPRVAITFDDAYRGAVRIGVAEVARRGLPATVFVCPGRLDGHAFWWDRFSTGPRLGAFRDLALGEGRGREELIEPLARAAGLRPADVPEVMTSASLDEFREAARSPGITLGAHSWSHPNLARATDEELEIELGDTARWLAPGDGRGLHAVPRLSVRPHTRTVREGRRACRLTGRAPHRRGVVPPRRSGALRLAEAERLGRDLRARLRTEAGALI